MSQYPEVSTSSYILSITSIMESWSYEAQEKGQRYSDLKVEREYKDLCNSIIEINYLISRFLHIDMSCGTSA